MYTPRCFGWTVSSILSLWDYVAA